MVSAQVKVLLAVLIGGQLLGTIGMFRLMRGRETDFTSSKTGQAVVDGMNKRVNVVS